jgi:hypothetical protein
MLRQKFDAFLQRRRRRFRRRFEFAQEVSQLDPYKVKPFKVSLRDRFLAPILRRIFVLCEPTLMSQNIENDISQNRNRTSLHEL